MINAKGDPYQMTLCVSRHTCSLSSAPRPRVYPNDNSAHQLPEAPDPPFSCAKPPDAYLTVMTVNFDFVIEQAALDQQTTSPLLCSPPGHRNAKAPVNPVTNSLAISHVVRTQTHKLFELTSG